MDRQGNRIAYTTDEQRKFNLPAEVPLSEALQTANAFLKAAEAIDSRVVQEIMDADLNPEIRAQQLGFAPRAVELSFFAKDIMSLCAPEIMATVFEETKTKE